jgi:hypothetical protein
VAESLPWFYRIGIGGLVFAAFMTQAKFIPSIRNNIGPFEIIGMFLIAAFLLSPRTVRPLRLNAAMQTAWAILAISVVSQVNIPDGRHQVGLINVAIQVFFTLFLVTFYNLLRQYRVSPETLLRWVALALLIVGPWIILSGLDTTGAVQEVGPFRNRAHMAAYMLSAFWMALVYSQWPGLRLRGKLIAYGGVAMTLYAVAVSGRRSVYLSLLLGLTALGITFLAASRQKRLRLVVAGIFILGIIYAMYEYGPRYLPQLQFFQDRVGMIDDRLGDALTVSEDEAAEKGFFALQREGIRLAVTTHPLIGIGWGGFAKSHYSPTGHEVHSTPLRFLAETGLIGFALYVVLMLTLVQSVWRGFMRMRRTPWGNAYFVLAVGLSSLLISYAYNRHVTERTFWLLMAVIFAMELFAARAHAGSRSAREHAAAAPQAALGGGPRLPRPASPLAPRATEGGALPPGPWAPPS